MITLDTLLEEAAIRFADGEHLAEAVVLDVAAGQDPEDIRDAAAQDGAFLTAYFADCLHRLQEATN